ncbi:MAG: hypothetical protein Q8Q75_11505 [Rhodoferax sp.]|nr:hypothetical protein [Rhodoferax sp.]MDP3865323.1 hypothetical protein [Rhodoferax sp.]
MGFSSGDRAPMVNGKGVKRNSRVAGASRQKTAKAPVIQRIKARMAP